MWNSSGWKHHFRNIWYPLGWTLFNLTKLSLNNFTTTKTPKFSPAATGEKKKANLKKFLGNLKVHLKTKSAPMVTTFDNIVNLSMLYGKLVNE